MEFNYQEFITRNIGFITEDEQHLLKNSRVFIAGTGGMGGAAVACLARMGVENFIIADIDFFEISNMNRQIFATLDSVGKDKAETTKECLLRINPEIRIELYDHSWSECLDDILSKVDVVINGCDDVVATIKLMRKAKEHSKTVVDAFASTLPNVYTVEPRDKRPEVIMNFPSLGRSLESLSQEDIDQCARREIEYVMVNSSTANHVVIDIAAEMISGKRSRISFAPMVWITGCLMSYEVTKVLLSKGHLAGARGIFINPWTYKVERPVSSFLAFIKLFFVRMFIRKVERGA